MFQKTEDDEKERKVMLVWEYYRFEALHENHMEDLNRLGAQGWELISAVPNIHKANSFFFYFKKIKQQ